MKLHAEDKNLNAMLAHHCAGPDCIQGIYPNGMMSDADAYQVCMTCAGIAYQTTPIERPKHEERYGQPPI